ncbi:hypothetical protein ACFOPQ_01400 [Deinococcus antarcticus]|uniref:Uncharacterized protein n=1 Tax=Deinococcus antarcticus TaxID=1298767 RepID=A0ABV8A229_9DEIO
MKLNDLIERLIAIRDQHGGDIPVDVGLNHEDDGFCSKEIELVDAETFLLDEGQVMPDGAVILHGGNIEMAPGVTEPPARDILREVLSERTRQVSHGFDSKHDDLHTSGELALAAAGYAINTSLDSVLYDVTVQVPTSSFTMPVNWPFPPEWFKPTNRRRDLIKAMALIVAEVERLDRLEEQQAIDGEPQ